MRNGNLSYHITGLVKSVYDIWEMDNSHIKVYQVELEIWMIYGKCEICLLHTMVTNLLKKFKKLIHNRNYSVYMRWLIDYTWRVHI